MLRTVRLRRAAVLATSALCLSPATGDAGVLSPAGYQPDVAVDGGGRGHVAWAEPRRESNPRAVIRYCQVPAGGSACASEALTLVPRTSAGFHTSSGFTSPVHVLLPAPGQVVVMASFDRQDPDCESCVRAVTWISTDGGATFSGPVVRGSLNPAGDALATANGQIWSTSHLAADVPFQSSSPGAFSAEAAELGPGENAGATVGVAPDGRPVVAWTAGEATVVRRFAQADLSDAALHAEGNWGDRTVVGAGWGIPRLAGGPSGLFLAHMDGRDVAVRKFGAAGSFDPAARFAGANQLFDLDQDASGSLHVLFQGVGERPGLRYAHSTASGDWYGHPVGTLNAPHEVEAAGAGQGRGFVVWRETSFEGAVHVAPLEHDVTPPAPPATPPAPPARDTTPPRIEVAWTRVGVTRGGAFTLRLGPLDEPAEATVVLTSAGKLRLSRRRAVLRVTPRAVAGAAGATLVVRGRLPRPALKLLRAKGRLAMRARVELRDAAGNAAQRTVGLRLRPAR